MIEIVEFAKRELGLFLAALVAVGMYIGICIAPYCQMLVLSHPAVIALLLTVLLCVCIAKVVELTKLVNKT